MSLVPPETWWLEVATGLGWGVGFARLATELLPHSFQSQVIGDLWRPAEILRVLGTSTL